MLKNMDQKLFLKQLSDLVAFQSLSGDLAVNSKALDYVEKCFNSKAVVKRVKNKNAEILIAGNKKIMTPDVAYLVHMDVVAAKQNQFTIQKKGDRIYGRGTSDMKFSIPLGIKLLNDLILEKSNISFSLVITTDEETGGFDGAFFLAEKLKFRPKCLIVPDGGDNLSFVNKAKGVCQIIIKASGSPAHASRPWMGKNALEPLIILSNRLLKKYGKNNKQESWKTTMNIGQIEGGVSTNQVCPEAEMKLDFRFPETDSYDRIFDEVKKMAIEIDPSLKVEFGSTGSPTFTDKKLPVVEKFLESMEGVFKKKIVIKETYGASDARHFSKYQIPILMMKPMGGEIHSDNEWVSLSSSLTFFKGLRMFLKKLEREK